MPAPEYKSVRLHKTTHRKLKLRAAQLDLPINNLIDRLFTLYAKDVAQR